MAVIEFSTKQEKICMKNIKPLIGPALLIPSIVFLVIWINSFKAGSEQSERVENYLSHFPAGTTVGALTTIAFLTSLGSVFAASSALRGSIIVIRIISLLTIFVGGVLTFMNVFQLL